MFLAVVPLAYFAERIENGVALQDVAGSMKGMTLTDLEEAGGYRTFLRSGSAAVVPPGYMIFKACRGLMPDDFKPEAMDKTSNLPGCVFMVTEFSFGVRIAAVA